jgi:hypothetical protein
MNEGKKIFLFFCVVFFTSLAYGYGLPSVSLGLTNILDGGPIRPNPGVYWQQYSTYYHTHKFLDFKGDRLGGIKSPVLNSWRTITQLIYQCKNKLFLEGTPGFSFVLPITLYSAIKPNKLGITNAGGGVGNLSIGVYSQWSAVMHNKRPLFIHRLSLDLSFPCGTNKLPDKDINPASSFFYLSPSWSATLYATEKLAFSWRLNYLWNAKSRKIDFKAGEALFFNYSIEYPIIPQLYLACVGYYLQQLSHNKIAGMMVPHSKERVFALGAGSAYFFSQDLIFFTYLYGELGVLNRPQGTNFILRIVKHF